MIAVVHDAWNLALPHNTAVVLRGVTVLGIACGVIGTFLLLRQRSLVADAVSHAALPGVCAGFLLATWLGMDGRPLVMLLGGAAVAGVLGIACIQGLVSLPRIKADAAIGVVLSVFFAVGVVLLGWIQNLPVSQKAGLDSFIFGQAATMSAGDSNMILLLAITTLLLAAVSFKELRLLCFDATFASSLGFSRHVLDGLLMGMVMMMTVIGLHAVGVLLMVALLIIPAVAARFWTDRLDMMALTAGAIGGIGSLGGTFISASLVNVPTGPAIVIACGVLFVLSMALGTSRGLTRDLFRQWRLSRAIARQHLLRAMYECQELQADDNMPVTSAALLTRRRWLKTNLYRALQRAIRQHDVIAVSGGYLLSERGHEDAKRAVRSHRLWEHYLATHADIAPSHVDRAADDIEHVLGEKLVRELESTLRIADVPRSPHRLTVEKAS